MKSARDGLYDYKQVVTGAQLRKGRTMASSRTERLLHAVALRQAVASWARMFYLAAIGLYAVYLLVLLLSRLLGIIPDWFALVTLAVPAILAVPAAVGLMKHPDRRAAARAVDVKAATHDLFLTNLVLDDAVGDFSPLVAERAELRAQEIAAPEVVRYTWRRRAAQLLAAPLVVALALLLPQLDPFGHAAEREKVALQRKKVETMRKNAEEKLALYDEKAVKAERSAEVERVTEDVKRTFRNLKPKDREGNLTRIGEQQKRAGDLWRKRSEEKLKDALARKPLDQQFGGAAMQKQAQWAKELKSGKTQSLEQEIEAIQSLARKAAEATDEAEKKALQKKLQQRMAGLNEFLKDGLNSQQMQAAMDRAIEQLQAAQNPALQQQALEGLQAELQLAKAEMQRLGQNLRDLQALEEALQALQAAKAAAKAGNMPGQGQMAQMEAMEAYQQLFQQMAGQGMMAGQGQGQGEGGMGAKGQGRGGSAPRDPALKTGFKTERSPSRLLAGKMLMEWKTRGLSEEGEVKEEYAAQVEVIRDSVEEAVLHENVPPGYRSAIRKYFNTLSEEQANGPARRATGGRAPAGEE